MDIRIDPEDSEKKALFEFVPDWTGKQVLEVGCGNGRLTRKFAAHAQHTTGIDPQADSIAKAIAQTTADLRDKVSFLVANLDLFVPKEKFDLAILSWSL